MGEIPRRRMRSVSVAIGVTAVTAAALSGCSSSPDYQAVCIEDASQERVADEECDDPGSTYRWYYLGGNQRVPSVGNRVSGGSTYQPSGSVGRGGQSSSGDSYRDSGGSYTDSGGSYTDSGSSSPDYGGFGGRGSGISS